VLARRIWRDIAGAAMVEYTLAFPVFALVALGTVDLTYMFAEWAMANKAAYLGARTAIVSDPVASNVTSPSFLFTADHLASSIGEACIDGSTGAANNGADASSLCPTTLSVTCTSTGCDGGGTFAATAFDTIFNAMKNRTQFSNLQPANVSIKYQVNGAGFVGMPGGLPMNVTVKVTNMTHQLFFAPAFLQFFGLTIPTSWPIPDFASTLTSECMQTNPTDPPTC
jgi:Flp pilus assembly protein TadG